MRRVLSAFIVTGLVAAPVASGQADRPSNFRKTSIRTGGTMSLDFEYVFDQRLQDVTLQSNLGSVVAGAEGRDLEAESASLLLHLAGAWADDSIGIEAYVDVGAATSRVNGSLLSMGVPTGFEADGDWGFVIGGGGRYRFFRIAGFSLFLDGWGRWSEASADIRVAGARVDRKTTRTITWQATLYASYEFQFGGDVRLAPYGGILFSGAQYKITDVFEPTQNDVVGAVGGVELGITPNVGLFAEGRFISQTAVAAGVTIGF